MWNVPGWRSRASEEVADVRISTFLSRFFDFFLISQIKQFPGLSPEPRPKVDARIHMALNCGARSCRIPKFDTKTSRFWHGDASNAPNHPARAKENEILTERRISAWASSAIMDLGRFTWRYTERQKCWNHQSRIFSKTSSLTKTTLWLKKRIPHP